MRADAESIIASIEELIRQNGKIDEFVPLIRQLVSVAPMSLASTYEPKAKLYRSTAHHPAVPKKIDELWYPPIEKAILGRANRDGQPMFYCSPDPGSTLLEIGAKVGALAVQAQWITAVPMLLHDLGYTAEVLSRAGARRKLPAHHQKFYENKLDDVNKRVRDFLALAFTEPTGANYSLTAAISEVHLGGLEFSGLLYPAIQKYANADNIVLTPDFVRKGLVLETAQLLEIDEVTSDGRIGGRILCDLSGTDPDGSLRWTFREQGTAVPPGGVYEVQMRPGKALRLQSAGGIQVDGHQFHVESGYSIELTDSGIIRTRDLRGNIVDEGSFASDLTRFERIIGVITKAREHQGEKICITAVCELKNPKFEDRRWFATAEPLWALEFREPIYVPGLIGVRHVLARGGKLGWFQNGSKTLLGVNLDGDRPHIGSDNCVQPEGLTITYASSDSALQSPLGALISRSNRMADLIFDQVIAESSSALRPLISAERTPFRAHRYWKVQLR